MNGHDICMKGTFHIYLCMRLFDYGEYDEYLHLTMDKHQVFLKRNLRSMTRSMFIGHWYIRFVALPSFLGIEYEF